MSIYALDMVGGRDKEALAGKLAALCPHLNERQWRLLLAVEARALGRGGIALVARAARVSRSTVDKGLAELAAGVGSDGRVRRPGGGRKPVEDIDPSLLAALAALMESNCREDGPSPMRWTVKSTNRLAAELTRQGTPVSARTVARLLKGAGYSLDAGFKTVAGRQNPDRDAQFRYLNGQAQQHLDAGQPVVSVDMKRQELIGGAAGRRRSGPAGRSVAADVSDFLGTQQGSAIPCRAYDLADTAGWLSVGCDQGTVTFAVATLRQWWQSFGEFAYPHAQRLLVGAAPSGLVGYRVRVWTSGLAHFAAETGLAVTVCHLPPGISRWNRIEHRLCSATSTNWHGRPLIRHEVIVDLIGNNITTGTGLAVHAERDTDNRPNRVKISGRRLEPAPVIRHDFHGSWNYTLAAGP